MAMDNMFRMINQKIEQYEVMVKVNEQIIEARKEEIKTDKSEFMKGLHKATIRAMEAQIEVYYKVIADMKAIKDEAFNDEEDVFELTDEDVLEWQYGNDYHKFVK